MRQMLLNEIKVLMAEFDGYLHHIHKNSSETRLNIQEKISRLLEYIRYREMWLMNSADTVSEASRTLVNESIINLRDFYQLVSSGMIDEKQFYEKFQKLKCELPTKEELGFKFYADDFQSIISQIGKLGTIHTTTLQYGHQTVNSNSDLAKWLKDENEILGDYISTCHLNSLLTYHIEKANQQPTGHWLVTGEENKFSSTMKVGNTLGMNQHSEWLYNYVCEMKDFNLSNWLISQNNNVTDVVNDTEVMVDENDLNRFLIKSSLTTDNCVLLEKDLDLSSWLKNNEVDDTDTIKNYSSSASSSSFVIHQIADDEMMIVPNEEDWQTMFKEEYLNGWLNRRDVDAIVADSNSIETSDKNIEIKSLENFLCTNSEFEGLIFGHSLDVLKNILDKPWQNYL